MKQKVINELGVKLRKAFTLQQDLSELNAEIRQKKAELEALTAELLAQAKQDEVFELSADGVVGTVKPRKQVVVSPDALLEYLEAHDKMYLAPTLMRTLHGKIGQYLGEDVKREIGVVDVEPYDRIKYVDKSAR